MNIKNAGPTGLDKKSLMQGPDVSHKADLNRRSFWICIFLALSTLVVYHQVGDFEFVNFDDPLYVTHNPIVQKGLSGETVAWAFTEATLETNYWVPLTWLTILLDYQLYGMNAGGFHLTNLFLHMLNTLLLFAALRRMTGRLWRSALVAALFALHPLHVESVAWVTERKDVLSSLFWMLTLLNYARYVERPGMWRYFTVFLGIVFGLMAKPMLVTLPFVLLLLDFWPFQRFAATDHQYLCKIPKRPVRQLLWEKVPFLALVVLVSVMTFLTQAEGGAVKSLSAYPLDVRVTNALAVYVAYIGKMLWPAGLAFFYPHPGSLPLWQPLMAGILLISMTIFALCFAQKRPYLIFGWLWYLGTLVPVIGLVVIGPYVMADRYTYISLIGLFVAIVWGAADIFSAKRYPTAVAASFSLLILTILAVISWYQAGYWQNSITLCKRAIAVNRNNITAHNNLAIALEARGRTDEAVRYYLETLEIDPDNAMLYNNLGYVLERQKKTVEAIYYYEKALQIDPKYVYAHNNLGNVFLSQKKYSAAIDHYRQALKSDPRYAKAHFNMGNAFFVQNEFDQAAFHYREAVRIEPLYAEAHNNLGSALALTGQMDRAIEHYREALKIRPDFHDAQNNLRHHLSARKQMHAEKLKMKQRLESDPLDIETRVKLGHLYKKEGDLEKAAVQYQAAVAIDSANIVALNNLGVIRAMQGEYETARSIFKKIIARRPDDVHAYYLVSGTYARQKKAAEAITWLKQAVDRGFDDWDLIKTDRNLERIRTTSYYIELMRGR